MSHEAPQPENNELSPPPTDASSAPPAAANDLQTANDALTAQVAELQDAWLRAKAEAENVRRRAQEDVSKAHKFAIEKFAESLLPVKDTLEMALADTNPDSLRVGVDMTLKNLLSAFEQMRVLSLRVEQLADMAQRLLEENRRLRHSQEQLSTERATLLAKNEQARSRVEAMIQRLKSLEQNA